ncbi:hypothetical protein Hypma_009852 [Hypsizygus marmoreus]|uniref:Uncharacterized protein n=1 Tax=Hypsizygus marmoreus TaxID=39966 RepID=A0A369JUL6_HYPMA|nr:hypothetical protein Hypma_009852 [Hypsizygus marmoreus]
MSPRAPDSRRYLMGRLPSYHGYADLPVIDDRFAFILPRFYQHTGRVVDMPGGMWELWSPNSRQTPYYPVSLLPPSYPCLPPISHNVGTTATLDASISAFRLKHYRLIARGTDSSCDRRLATRSETNS